MATENGLRIVLLGGGTGLPVILNGLKQYTKNLTAIVTVTDEGRSSGILRKEMNIPPPGDIRNNLIALSQSEKIMNDLFQYRFEEGSLKGHCFGNLFLAALAKITGNFGKAVEEAGRILNISGEVFPTSLEDVHVCAELEDGTLLKSEQEIVVKGKAVRDIKRTKIKRVFLTPENAVANPQAVARIKAADLLVLGPGSLATSVLPALLLPEIKKAIAESKAVKVYICNIMTQAGQTDGFTASDHVSMIVQHLGKGVLTHVLLNMQMPPPRVKEAYEKEKSYLVENDIAHIKAMGGIPVLEDLLESSPEKKVIWEKQHYLRHEPEKIASALLRLIS